MQCTLVDKVDYLNTKEMLNIQREVRGLSSTTSGRTKIPEFDRPS